MQKYLLTISIVLLSLATWTVGCKKVEDPPIPVGKPLPYTAPPPKATRSMIQLFDSLPQTTFYKAAWQRADLNHYIDSLRGSDTLSPYTLFIPTDSAFKQAGYATIDQVNNAPVAELDSLLRYLAIPGTTAFYDTLPLAMGTTTYYPLMYPNPVFESPGFPAVPYSYKITLGSYNNTLYLNGKQVGGHTTPIVATDGSIFLIDSIVTRPMPFTTADLLHADTSYCFYLAACNISDSIYNYQQDYGFPYDDTSYLYLNKNSPNRGWDGWAEVFAPDNNAFRNAGFLTIDDIRNYIDTSAIALENPYAYPYIYMLTNMDSILANHRLLSGQGGNFAEVNPGVSYVYTIDMLYNPGMRAMNNGLYGGAIFFQNSSGQVVIHRQDFPDGRAAHVISPYDVTTLTGVLHRVDNLLLPTP